MSDERFDDEIEPSEPVFSGIFLPAAIGVVALLVGAVGGGTFAWMVARSDVDVVDRARDLTRAELEAACAPLVGDAATTLEGANEKVVALETEILQREAAVRDLEARIAQRADRDGALARELEAARGELRTLRVRLESAVAEKRELLEALRRTEEELGTAVEATRTAREDASHSRWSSFRNAAQLEICEKGGRKKLGKCREQVLASLDGAHAERYAHCVRTGQAVPSLHELAKGATLPDFASFLDQDSRITRDWYVQFCDPTLPEASERVVAGELDE